MEWLSSFVNASSGSISWSPTAAGDSKRSLDRRAYMCYFCLIIAGAYPGGPTGALPPPPSTQTYTGRPKRKL